MPGDPISKDDQLRRADRPVKKPWRDRSRKPINPMSDRPGAADQRQADWEAGQEAMRLDRYRCMAKGILPHDCIERDGTDPQHLAPRNVRPDLVDCIDNITTVCRFGHQALEADPILARKRGLHRHSGDPVVPPRPHLVDPDGNIVRPEDFR